MRATIYLPAQLHTLDLPALNRRLRAGDVVLDWSAVDVTVTRAEDLATLFSGLALDAISDQLNIPTIPEALQPAIADAFKGGSGSNATADRTPVSRRLARTTSASWHPDDELMEEREQAHQAMTQKTLPLDHTMLERRRTSMHAPSIDTPALQPSGRAAPLEGARRLRPDDLPNDGPPQGGRPYQTDTVDLTGYDRRQESTTSALLSPAPDMHELAFCNLSALPTMLQPLVQTYRDLLVNPSAVLETLTDYTGKEDLRQAQGRLQAAITLLQTNRHAARAFSLMNRAMWLQRLHTCYVNARLLGDSPTLRMFDTPEQRIWQARHLAFILLNIPHDPVQARAALTHADLRWFPEGSQADAYLGLTAYSLLLLRLHGTQMEQAGKKGSVESLRYMRRPLSLHHFQRLSSLICACEMIRRLESQILGGMPFRLVLPTGPFHHCPWCGSMFDTTSTIIRASFDQGRTLLYCSSSSDQQCPFTRSTSPGKGLPVLLLDGERTQYLST